VNGMKLIRALYEMGALSEDVNSTNDAAMQQAFQDKQAAMRLDGSWYANGLPTDNWDNTVVIPFPSYDPSSDPTATIGGTSMGFYLTRKAWNNPLKRDAAVQLLATLTSDDSVGKLGFSFGGELMRSAKAMLGSADTLCSPIQDSMAKDARDYWFQQIPSIADGSADPAQVMSDVIGREAFS